MWIGVTPRFTQFLGNLKLTDDQITDGRTKYRAVTRCLNRAYWNSTSEGANSRLVGSWGKSTRMRPPRDVDMLFELPAEVYHRFDQRTGNKQSALLQEVKGHLQVTYPSTTMRGDGQVIVVRFNSINVEVLPAFRLTSGQYWICDTNDGGRYNTTDPIAEVEHMSAANTSTNGNARALTKMAKCWQAECNVPLKSFWIELLAIDFLYQWPYRSNSAFYHDWMTRDFFAYLYGRANTFVTVPGTGEWIWLGNDWQGKAEIAYHRAFRAERQEAADRTDDAGEEWQKVFGLYIPKYV